MKRVRLRKSTIVAVVGISTLLAAFHLVYQNAKISICQVDPGLSDLSSLIFPESKLDTIMSRGGYYNFSARVGGSPKRYMLTLRIREQLTMSSIHFHQFLNLVDDWNFTGVEPFIYGSTMYGLRSLHSRDPNGSIPFGLLFNSTKHNAYLSKCMKRQSDPQAGHPVLFEPMSEFLCHSYRQLVLVYFASHVSTLTCSTWTSFKRLIEHSYEEGPVVDCTRAAHTRGVFKYVEGLLARELKIERLFPSSRRPVEIFAHKNFKAVQAFCVKKNAQLSLKDLKRYILSHIRTSEVSVVFISWQDRFTHLFVDSDIKNYINKCRLPFSQPLHSDFVMNTAKLYVDSLGFRGAHYLSIHVRFEKLYLYVTHLGKSVDAYLDCCVRRLNSLLSAVTSKLNISKSNVLLHWDYSPYGSLSGCPIWWCGHVTNTYLKRIKAIPSYFEPMKFGIPINHGLISLVEMNALLGGRALVTVGDGSYQTTLIETFIQHHRDQSNPETLKILHYGHLCIPPENLHDLSRSITPEC